ncbi:hypothetical protein [Pseudomonas sp. BIC9C]|uniref:hypothetical protein n=1 Tax=Pseudomonas sp. BIC9C TaxID=3078458 RepID=UPI002AD3BBBB|nr:hypothetical protein [Pseudomonas sp. BIC9C]
MSIEGRIFVLLSVSTRLQMIAKAQLSLVGEAVYSLRDHLSASRAGIFCFSIQYLTQCRKCRFVGRFSDIEISSNLMQQMFD